MTETAQTTEAPVAIHSSIAHLQRILNKYDHLPPHLQNIAKQFAEICNWVVEHVPHTPEISVALRHIIDAKNSAVLSQALHDEDNKPA